MPLSVEDVLAHRERHDPFPARSGTIPPVKAAPRVRIEHPNSETTRLRIALSDSRTREGLEVGLDALLEATRDLGALITNPKELGSDEKYAWYLVTTFHTPAKTFLREGRFFERCARFPALHAKMLQYAKQVDAKARGLRVAFGNGLSHDDTHPAGCYAIVPLVMRDPRHVDALIEHMRGSDLDHESFHASLIETLIVVHGLCDPIRDLLAFRAVDGAGQHGEDNLRLAVQRHGFGEELRAPNGVEAFAARVDRISRRAPGSKGPDGAYRALYVANAGKALFAGDPVKYARWLALFEKRRLSFDDAEREPPKEHESTWAPGPFDEEWVDLDA